MATEFVKIGDKTIEHQEVTLEQQRFLRARYLLSNMSPELVRDAEKCGKVAVGALQFVRMVAGFVEEIDEGRAEPAILLPLHMDRLEDVFMWSTGQGPELSRAQKRRVVEWCRRDGHGELADRAEEKINEEEVEDAE